MLHPAENRTGSKCVPCGVDFVPLMNAYSNPELAQMQSIALLDQVEMSELCGCRNCDTRHLQRIEIEAIESMDCPFAWFDHCTDRDGSGHLSHDSVEEGRIALNGRVSDHVANMWQLGSPAVPPDRLVGPKQATGCIDGERREVGAVAMLDG